MLVPALAAALIFRGPCLAAGPALPDSFVINGRFEGARGWELEAGAAIGERAPGDPCLEIGVGANQYVAVLPTWRTLTVAVDMQVEAIEQDPEGGFAYTAVYQYDTDDAITTFCDVVDLRRPTDWRRHVKTFELAPQTTAIRIRLGFFRAKGKARFDNVTLVEGQRSTEIDRVAEWAGRDGLGPEVLIWDEPGLPVPAGGMPPRWVERVLANADLGARRCGSEALPDALRPDKAGVLILPHGAAYPHALRGHLVNFCRAGGRLLVVGGYPLNAPMIQRDGEWVNHREELARERGARLRWPSNLLPDGGFEHTVDAPLGGDEPDATWRRDVRCEIVEDDPTEGSACATVEVGREEKDVIERRWYAFIRAAPQREYHFTCRIRTESVQGDGIAFAAVYEYTGGKLIKPHDALLLRGDNAWQEAVLEFTTQPEVDRLYIKLGLYRVTGRVWFDQVQLVDVSGLRFRPLNTSAGTPGDWMQFTPEQMPMCEVGSPLTRVVSLSPTPGQGVLMGPRLQSELTGWMASGLTGAANARWVPLLDSLDRYGRSRGAAGALLLHHRGFYRHSLWAYFPVENRPVFGPTVPGSGRQLADLVVWLGRGWFLHSFRGEDDLVTPGSPIAVRLQATNAGGPALAGVVRLTAVSAGREVARAETPVTLAPGQSTELSQRLAVSAPRTGLLELRAQLVVGGRTIDELASGVVIQDPAALLSGPRLDWRDNYLQLNGRPCFVFGSDSWCDHYGYAEMNPLRWDRMHAVARDHGVQLYENLQYSSPDHRMAHTDWRRFEAMGQLLQERGLIFMPCLLVGHNVAVDDGQLAVEDEQCGDYARVLGHIPGLLWYLNGDFQFRYDDPKWARRAWNEWLKQEYADEAALAMAWGLEHLPAPLGQLDFPPPTAPAWDDRAAVDKTRFEAWVMRRWIESHVARIRAHGRERPLTSEYYSEPSGSIDLRLSLGSHDISNFGYFTPPEDDLRALPERIAVNDMRCVGQGVSIGEYGVKTSPAFGPDTGATGYYVARTEEAQQQLFLSVAAYGLGMGVSRVQNWSLRDEDGAVTGWGILHNGRSEPKDIAYTHRNVSVLWRLLAPRYEPPETAILCPTPLRVGNYANWGTTAVYSAAQGLLRLHVPFSVADDFRAGRLSDSTRTVIWPVAVAAADRDRFAAVEWVEAGGQLITSGYPGWDDRRRRVTGERLAELFGAEVTGPVFDGVDRKSGPPVAADLAEVVLTLRPQARLAALSDTRVLLAAADGQPLVVSRALGRGMAVWIADPVELEQDRAKIGALVSLYRLALGALPAPPQAISVSPDDPALHVMRQPTATGAAWVVDGVGPETPAQVSLRTPAGAVRLRTRPWWPQTIVASDDGRMLVGLVDGSLWVGDRPLVAEGPLVGLASLDGQDLRASEAILLCPFGPGELRSELLRFPVEWGEWRDGLWTPLERVRPNGGLLTIDTDQVTCVALLCRRDAPRWRRHLTRLMTRPWTVPGY